MRDGVFVTGTGSEDRFFLVIRGSVVDGILPNSEVAGKYLVPNGDMIGVGSGGGGGRPEPGKWGVFSVLRRYPVVVK